MGVFSDESAYVKNYYDVTGTTKAAKGKPKAEEFKVGTKKLIIAGALFVAGVVAIGASAIAANNDRASYNNKYKNNAEYNMGYNDGLTDSYNVSDATIDDYNLGYKDGCKDREAEQK